MTTAREDYAWSCDLIAPMATTDHVDNLQIASMLFEGWMAFMARIVEGAGDDFVVGDVRPIVREITAGFLAEIAPLEPLTCGVRAHRRSHRSFVLDQALWRAGDHAVAEGRVVLVTLDVATRRPVAVPDSLWQSMIGLGGQSKSETTGASSAVTGEET